MYCTCSPGHLPCSSSCGLKMKSFLIIDCLDMKVGKFLDIGVFCGLLRDWHVIHGQNSEVEVEFANGNRNLMYIGLDSLGVLPECGVTCTLCAASHCSAFIVRHFSLLSACTQNLFGNVFLLYAMVHRAEQSLANYISKVIDCFSFFRSLGHP